jgi:hypothetical protein
MTAAGVAVFVLARHFPPASDLPDRPFGRLRVQPCFQNISISI